MKKELELAKIKEKNKRIKKILDDIGVTDPIYEPEMGSVEKPEMLLTTTDDEVMPVKYYYSFYRCYSLYRCYSFYRCYYHRHPCCSLVCVF